MGEPERKLQVWTFRLLLMVMPATALNVALTLVTLGLRVESTRQEMALEQRVAALERQIALGQGGVAATGQTTR